MRHPLVILEMNILFLVCAARPPCDAAATFVLGKSTLKIGFRIHPERGAMIRNICHIFLMLVLSGAGMTAKYDKCTKGNKDAIGDLKCDKDNNNEECGYDGGDCCPCTSNFVSWFDDTITEVWDIFCRDPSSGCLDPRVETYPNCTGGVIPDIGDGWCDMENNNEGCLFDGGDCCECTRASNESSFSRCVDPGAACYNPTAVTVQPSCINGNIEYIGDGWCNLENNNKECLYDGGDCCMCTCTNGPISSCGSFGFWCVDPDVSTKEANLCLELPSTIPACPVELQSEWFVETGIQAKELVKAIRCSGGSFHVTWKGKVILDEPITIFNGTFLNVTSADGADSVIFGDGKSRLFAVVNASLHLCNITLSNGNTTYGGAIAASHSRLTFEGVTFTGNVASYSGGAIFLSQQTYASFGGEIGSTTFTGNAATSGGGGTLYVEGGSYVSWTGNSIFSENSCLGDGGAVFLAGGSYALWTGNTTFTDNAAARVGGAVYIAAGSRALWKAKSHFHGNNATAGGALMLSIYSTASWTAESYFVANRANYGGAVFLEVESNAAWAGKSFFFENTANAAGGALCVAYDSVVTWTDQSYFLANCAGYDGGALRIGEGSKATWTAAALFSTNSVARSGGAVFAGFGASLSWNGTSSFVDNIAWAGGAICVVNGVMVKWSGETSFISNSAWSNGGAVGSAILKYTIPVYANKERSKIVFKGATSFVNNECWGNGGGMVSVQSLDISFQNNDIIFLGNTAGSSGGAVFIGGTGIGTAFENVSFIENTAQIGGGVRVTASGTTMTVNANQEQVVNPTTFDQCSFVDNAAFGTGGAIDSASGQDIYVNTLFKGNVAKMGGALRLAGKVSVDKCSFIDNVSELGGGPAVSNVGFISKITTSNFHHNTFNCEPQTFLDFVKVSTTFVKRLHFFPNIETFADAPNIYASNRSACCCTQGHFVFEIACTGSSLITLVW